MVKKDKNRKIIITFIKNKKGLKKVVINFPPNRKKCFKREKKESKLILEIIFGNKKKDNNWKMLKRVIKFLSNNEQKSFSKREN